MSTKTIFPSNSIYTPVSIGTWNSLFTGLKTQSITLTMSQENTSDNEFPLTIEITYLGVNAYMISLTLSNESMDDTLILTGSNHPFKSTTPLPTGLFNPTNGIQIGTSSGAVINDSSAISRPCSFVWYLDTQGYLYCAQSYMAGTNVTSVYSVGWSTTYHYFKAVWTIGTVNTNNTSNAVKCDNTFIVYVPAL